MYVLGIDVLNGNMVYIRYIQSTCATSGEGLYEGLDWLSNNIANKVNDWMDSQSQNVLLPKKRSQNVV